MGDHRADVLRTQAVNSLLSTLGAGQVNVYGNDTSQWAGVVLDNDASMRAVSHWVDETGAKWRYHVLVEVTVTRELV